MARNCFGLAAFFAVLVMCTAIADAATRGRCAPTKTEYLASEATTVATTTGNVDFVTVNEGTVNFTQGGTGPSCVIVQLFMVVAVNNNLAYVRARLDSTQGAPGEIGYVGSETAVRTDVAGAMAFVFPSVAPGSHRVRIQIGASSGTVTAFEHTILVLHR